MPKEKISDETLEFAAESLTGDVRDALLAQIRTLQKPYARCSQDEQQQIIEHAERVAINLVERAVQIIASEGRKALVGQLMKIQLKDGIQCQINFNKTDALRHDLFDAQGLAVMLVVADPKPFTGEKEPAKPDPDQNVMPLHLAKDEDDDHDQ